MWWWRSSLHVRHDMVSCDQCREDQDEAWLDGPVARVKGKSEALKWGTMCDGEAWARLGADGPRQQWRASEVKIDEPIPSRDDMKWIISFGDCLVHVLHQHWRRWMESARQRYNLGHFHFTGYRYVEKFMTGFRIDGRTIKRGKLVCMSVI